MPSHSDDDMSISQSPSASPEKPIKVVLETEPPVRKPGRPRLDISAHFQDTGEMANHSHRFVWCVACIKSGRPLYKKDRLPARGDLMQRHLQTCKYVNDEVRLKFCSSSRSSSASSSGESKARKARIANIISGAASSSPSSPLNTTRAGARAASKAPLVSSALSSKAIHAAASLSASPSSPSSSSQPPSAAVSPYAASEPILPPISTLPVPERSYAYHVKNVTAADAVVSRPASHSLSAGIPQPPSSSSASLHLTLRPPFSNSRPSSSPCSENGQMLPRIRSPQMRSATPIDLPAISRRSHPYYTRDPHHPVNHHHHGSRAGAAPRAAQAYASVSRTPPPPLLHRSYPQHNMRTSPPTVASVAGGASEPVVSSPYSHSQRMSPPEPLVTGSGHQVPLRQRSMASLSSVASYGSCCRLRRKIQAGQPAYGIMLGIASPATAQTASRLGFDWACVDVEHSQQPAALMAEMVAAINSVGTCTALVRVPSNSGEWIKWAVDAGAQGVILPDIQSRDQLWSLVGVCRDAGHRAGRLSPALQSQGEGSPAKHVAGALPMDFMVIPQIDRPEAVANIDEILSVPGIDAAFVRTQSLAGSQRSSRLMASHASANHATVDSRRALGFHTAAVDEHREAALERISACGRHYSVPVGVDGTDGHSARGRARQGFLMVSVGSDLDIFTAAAAEQLRLVLA
ncbi:hypothetical protein IW140_004435 [Coemansia sp. RSA 1813]|nr:hypothetical protein EV178_005194 [Coemansia sp. RSA 1646]KAJ1770300.1 hypothetical protein LPJ74_003304 [Coemansia sp. RSA 1843]KAJ2087765.1 hypothetical protein IW138_004735 [Coemansia sp. RSA 986]KAJ2211832.1 hypothetical protein EV179_005163 [Coemansia sp. RSA 487]KAJ2567527.1 hypothetical protein IW140_004435 [Coemansia sp. RSA 1813]